MKINKLTISNFAGIKEVTFNFDGKDAKIYGNNATGKTTTATALQWLLFDKGLDGSTKSFNPVPLNEKNEENYELIPTVFAEFEIDGKITTFKKESHPKYTINQKTNRKEYSRSRTKKQYINDESIKVMLHSLSNCAYAIAVLHYSMVNRRIRKYRNIHIL
ncbi:hypothetical protein O736_02555 [Staphylococcus aureus M0625]|nr:hypothetical protein O736_02555 [Staphylococcus aureus M0625]